MKKRINYGLLILNLIIPLLVGALSSILTKNATEMFNQNAVKPFLSPPSIVFPIVWTVLFILMGISSYIIVTSHHLDKTEAILIYALTLIMNFFWTIIFFNGQKYLFSFIWIIGLWIAIYFMIKKYAKINPVAAYLQIPYFIWVTFAAYLNLGVFFLNM